jgi:LysR family transcriptional regulator of gallate degradation
LELDILADELILRFIRETMIRIDPNGIPELSLRQLKACLYVCEEKNVTKAAYQLNRSQTAVTKALTDLEATLERQLFERTSSGMLPTIYGEILAKRIARAINEFKLVGEKFREYQPNAKARLNNPIFSMDISFKRLSAFVALYHLLNVQRAAEQLSLTKAAIYSSVRQLEEWLNIELFSSEPNGVVPNPFCHILAQHTKLAFAEIRYGLEDMANTDGVSMGAVNIGTLPYTRTYMTPHAINALLVDSPELDVTTFEGSYGAMESSLRCGDIDFIIGAVRPADECLDICTEILFEDRLSIIARKNHPLSGKTSVLLQDLNEYGWVLPKLYTPSGKLFLDTLRNHDSEIPKHSIHTSSLSMLRGLLIDSNRVALLSEHQIYYDQLAGLLDVLDVEMEDTYRPIGITMRKYGKPSPAAQLFLEKIRNVASSIVCE